jgi:hypothetical protein
MAHNVHAADPRPPGRPRLGRPQATTQIVPETGTLAREPPGSGEVAGACAVAGRGPRQGGGLVGPLVLLVAGTSLWITMFLPQPRPPQRGGHAADGSQPITPGGTRLSSRAGHPEEPPDAWRPGTGAG